MSSARSWQTRLATLRTTSGRWATAALVSLGYVSEVAALQDLQLLSRGKVRDIYAVGEDRLLMVASDRISTYDVVHPTPIPNKGRVLAGLSVFWFERTEQICPNHLLSYTDVPQDARGRGMLVERLEMVPVECVVRGYLTGSGWKDYQGTGAVCGIELPEGLQESDRLPEPIFTPATKFELGRRPDGTIVLADEVLTPDSSRFWPAGGYAPGRAQPSFDKQYVRDWASETGWDKSPPAPPLPSKVVDGTRARYVEAYERIAGEPFKAWLERSGAV